VPSGTVRSTPASAVVAPKLFVTPSTRTANDEDRDEDTVTDPSTASSVPRVSAEAAIVVRGLRKAYGPVEALRGIDLNVAAGQIFALLGPNGAGKTTAVEILEGHRSRDAGEVAVLGHDPARPTSAWRARVGVVPQRSQLQADLTVCEWLELFAGYYPAPRPVTEVIERTGLGPQRDRRAARLSGGQQRRLDLALALIGGPRLLFLDEPTTGFDPEARREAWSALEGLRREGTTIFLTTHYLDEAEALADRVAVVAGGRIVAEGPPDALGAESAPRSTRISARLCATVTAAELPQELANARLDHDDGSTRVELESTAPAPALHVLTGWALDRGVRLEELEVRRPRLEDAYLELVRGAAAEEEVTT